MADLVANLLPCIKPRCTLVPPLLLVRLHQQTVVVDPAAGARALEVEEASAGSGPSAHPRSRPADRTTLPVGGLAHRAAKARM